MSDQLLPDFDGPRDHDTPPAPKKPRRKPAKKVTKRVKLPVAKPAKRVPKKRRVRKTGKYQSIASPAGIKNTGPVVTDSSLLTTAEFNATLDIISMLHAFEPLIRRRIMDRLIKTFP